MTELLALVAAAAPQRLRPFDLAIVAVYLVGITLYGLHFRRRTRAKAAKADGAGKAVAADRSLKSYFLADNVIPWWAIALSVVSAETSTLTIISIPGVAFAGDFGFLQVALGYMAGRVVVALLFLPRYFAGEMLTAYQLIDRRFGRVLHKITAALFLAMRAAAEGVRVFAVAIVVGIAIGTRDVWSIAIITALTLLYTFEGGLAAVIWTDVVQMVIYGGGTLVALITLGTHVHGGWGAIHVVAGAAGKFHWLNFARNLTTTYTFWAGLLGGMFLTMASHGTDQLMVQRLLAARSLRQSQAALLSSGVVIFAQFWMFLLIGAGLFVFYGQHPAALPQGMGADRLFPAFIVREMPIGVAGLLIAAILAAAMSNLSAALNSLSSTTIVDFYVVARPQSSERERTMVAKSSTVVWALVLLAIAIYSAHAGGKGHVVEIGLSIASVAYGCMLGVFLLGTLTRFATQAGACVGMVGGFALNLWLWQGKFPVRVGPLTIPHIAWTWYVLIGAAVTFGLGAVVSVLLRPWTPRTTRATKMAGLMVCVLLASAVYPRTLQAQRRAKHAVAARSSKQETRYDFAQVSTLINDAIAQHKLPGAVMVVGHDGRVVFERAYGERKLAGEPGLNGKASAAEPMTRNTIFDMASLSKVLSTTTAVMQLYEQGKIALDAPVEQYLPEFNPQHDPVRAEVTLRMLLTHTSGEPPDIDLKDAWGLAAPDKAEGIRRALATPLMSAPGAVFRYSDVNFILLGDLVETLSGETLDAYAAQHIFAPLEMTDTRYLPLAKACGIRDVVTGAAIHLRAGRMVGVSRYACAPGSWSPALLLKRIAPTSHDDEGTAETNPDYGLLLRGTVQDPTTRRMGGVAGHAGVFSTAQDASLFAQAFLNKLLFNKGPFPLRQSTLELMTTPEQPATVGPGKILTRDASSATPALSVVMGMPVRGFGWDINSAYSRPRGAVFPTAAPSEPTSSMPSFGHTGFTGTSIWMDPDSDTYIVLLANSVHPYVRESISHLRGDVATAVGEALGLDGHDAPPPAPRVLVGVDVLEQEKFAPLAELASKGQGVNKKGQGLRAKGQAKARLRVGLLTNQTGVDAQGRSTAEVLEHELPRAVRGARLVRLFTPEHGLYGRQDTTAMQAETDAALGVPVVGLYGAHDADRHPTHEELKDLDAVVIDLQDAGVRFYTYDTLVGYFLEAAAEERDVYHHRLTIVVLDRPDPVGGFAVEGPVSEASMASYTDLMPLPVRTGMTIGELARYIDGTLVGEDGQPLAAPLVVVPMENWRRGEFFDETGVAWVDPSPNLRSANAEVIYPGLGLIEGTNVSVGRGTAQPFEAFGAGMEKDSVAGAMQPAWFHAAAVAAALNARQIPGVSFAPTTMTIAEDAHEYPFHGQTIEAVRVSVTNRRVFNSPEMGVEILSVLHRLYPTQFKLEDALTALGNHAVLDAIAHGDDPRAIAAAWQPELRKFAAAREPFLLY